jgi:hypothetical protein
MERMPRRRDRLVAAAITGVAVALSPVALGSLGVGAPAYADDSGPVPTPSPSALESIAPGGSGTPAPTGPASSADPSVTTAGAIGRLTDEFVSPVLERLFLTVTLVVTSPVAAGGSPQVGQGKGGVKPQPATNLEPGGGSSSQPRDWKPKGPIKVPVAASVPSGKGRKSLTKEQIIWAAYTSAAKAESTQCHIPVMLLAAIGEVESSSLRGRRLNADHDAVPPVRGPALSGGTYAAIRDSDGGSLDGDPVWDRAVGPMQFIPGTWRIWGADGNGDGVEDPNNIEDAALAAARYLCAGGRDLRRDADLRAAVLSYNHSLRYASTVLGLVDAVMSGAVAGP